MCDATKNSIPCQPPEPQTQSYIQAQVYNIPPTAIPTYPAVQPVQQNEGWWKLTQKNKPQLNSVGTASLIFTSGGMSMAWGLGFFPSTKHLTLSWFLGGIIGAIIGAFACNHITKKLLMQFASIMVVICGITQVADPSSYDAILASRYLNGIAVGLVFPMTFVLIGEEVVKSLRGINAVSVDTLSFSLGIFIQIIYPILWSSPNENGLTSVQIIGILNIIFGIVAFIMASFLIIESPVYYLSHGDEQMAIDSLRRLQKPFIITHETYAQLEEHKKYFSENKTRTLMENAVFGMPALLKLCFYRSFMALGFSYFVNFAFTYSSFLATGLQTYPHILYALARLLGPITVIFTIDRKGRKSPTILGFFVCAILSFTVGGIFHKRLNLIDRMNAIKYILIFFQLFVSISMSSSSAYLSEAFPLAVKPYYVAIVFIVEMLVHIIIISGKDFYMQNVFIFSEYFLTLGALMTVFLGVAIYFLPETKCCSLRECLVKFRQSNNFRN